MRHQDQLILQAPKYHACQINGLHRCWQQHQCCLQCEARAARLTCTIVLQGGAAAWWTRSGHVVVQPLINGRAVGYMILDTGTPPPFPPPLRGP